jgi:hypothetical protein
LWEVLEEEGLVEAEVCWKGEEMRSGWSGRKIGERLFVALAGVV